MEISNNFAGYDHYKHPKPPHRRPRKPKKPRLSSPYVRNVKNYFKTMSKTLRSKRRLHRKIKRRVRRDYPKKPKRYRTHVVEVPAFERHYGFR